MTSRLLLKAFGKTIGEILFMVALAIAPATIHAANTNTFNFNNTTATTSSGNAIGPINPASGATSISGASLNTGDAVIFDGVVIDIPGSGSDAWGSVDLNGSGYGGVVNATLGVLVETGTSSGNPCQLFLNGSGTGNKFGISQGYRTNRVQIILTCTRTGSTTNMSYAVKIDQGATGTFNAVTNGTGVNFANNTISLNFGANNASHLFVQTQPVIAVSAPSPAAATVAVGIPATFSETITQGYPINTSQQWLSNGVPIPGATGLTYSTPPTTTDYNGVQYSVVVTNLLTAGNIVTSSAVTLTIRSVPGIVPFIFNSTDIPNSSQVNPLNPPVFISGSSLLVGDTVVFDGIVATNGPFTGGGNGWASINLMAGGYQGVTAAQLGLLVRLGNGTGQLYVNGNGPVSPNPTSSGAATNRAHIELYPSMTGSTTNMGWMVEVDQNLTGTYLPAVTGTNLTFPSNSIPLSFGADSVAALIAPFPTGLQAIQQQLSASNYVIGQFDQIMVTGNYLNVSNVTISPTTPGLAYSSSNPNVVTVATNGYLQFVGAGQATIISTFSSYSASNTVSVVDPGALLGISLVVSNQMPLYSNQQAVVLGTFANATNVNLLNYGQTAFTLNNSNIVTISASGLITAIAPGSAVIGASNSGFTSAARQVIVSYPTNRFIFDSFGDGFWTILNQGNSNTLVVNPGGASQASSTNTAFDQQFEVLYNYQNSTFRIHNRANWQCFGARPGNLVGTAVVPVNYTGAASQQWYLVDVGNGCYRIVDSQNGLVLQTDNGNPASVTLANASSSPYQNWSFAYQAHYPKKGCSGYETDYAQLELNWAYNYDDHPALTLPPSVNYVPMIYAAQYYEPLSDAQAKVAGWLSSAPPAYLLAYNEPDNVASGGGSNTSTNDVIALWPQIQALNVPLVSPATANTFGSWMYNFYSMIAANNYRVDYTAVHQYVPPNAGSLMGQLQSAYNTWGRPVWLTEFSPVDWNHTQSWSENDDYNFLAEFMWQAEAQDWLKRYAIFPFAGTNSASPWVDNGYTGTFFYPDYATLTPYGELYATWDADLSIDARTPYIIHNLGTSFRLTATNGVSTPLASTIYVRNATTEWGLLPAPTSNHWYIISLNDGRRLRDTSGNLNFAPFLATGSSLEWEFNGPDSSGYYFITNTAGHCLYGFGTPPAISFNTTTASTQNNNTRWRLVKAYQPVSTLASVPNNLSLNFTSQGMSLNWSSDSNLYYNVYRGTTNGGPYSLIYRVATTNFTDTTAASNSVPYYYVVTGLNAFGDESAYSPQAAATIASAWRQQWFGTTANSGAAADTANPANDGIINILKRAFNLNPTVAETSGTPYGILNGGTFTMTYQKSLAATDLIFQVVESTDLTHWTTNNISDRVISNDGVIEIHAASLPVTNATQFLRLQITGTQ
jgi:hypothetical protein